MDKKIAKIFIAFVFIIFQGIVPVIASELETDFERKHADRSALFLLDNLTLELHDNWSYTTKLHKKVKILKEDAKSWGEIPIPYEKGKDTVRVAFAYTITPDGRKHQYTKIQDFNAYDGFPMYSDSMVKVITLPEVNVGSIIEFEAIIVSKGSSIKNAFWDTIDFDFSCPTQEANTKVILSKKLHISSKEFDLKRRPVVTEDRNTIIYTWKVLNFDAFGKGEEYIPPPKPDSFHDLIEFSSIPSWADVSKWYYALVQKNLKINNDMETTAKDLTKGKVLLRDKTRAILEYVQDNFRYVSMSFGENSLEPHPTDEVFRNKYGDCKDLSLLCMAMLKSVGIESHMVLFNTEFSLSDPKYDLPFPTLFDHVILLVQDKANGDFYIDPLLDGYDIGEFPSNFQGAYTFIIDDKDGKFDRFPIFDEKRNSTKTIKKIVIQADGSALFETEYNWDLDKSIKTRASLTSMDKEAETNFYQALDASIASGGEMLERRVEGLDKKYGLLKGYSKFKRKNSFSLNGDMMIIDVVGYGRDLDFTQKERRNSIFYPSNTLVEEVTGYVIPKGFEVMYLPENINLKLGFFEMKREYMHKGNTIIIVESTRLKRSLYPKEDYAKFKEFFDKLPSQTQQRIVLKKTKSWLRNK